MFEEKYINKKTRNFTNKAIFSIEFKLLTSKKNPYIIV